ncbi:MAG: hypothetical protein DWQ37_04480 [Planctomycetota bacterium]|nr:MAG: hypothetical protein DWQ37_04480 [Planctomycetota bacterium]
MVFRAQPLLVTASLWLLSASLAFGVEHELKGLADQVRVEFDAFGVPSIYASSWPDAARALGYLHASDRLRQMDMMRRQASGSSAEVLGKQSLDADTLMRQLGTRRTCETLWKSGELPERFRGELESYAAGVDARINELEELPPMLIAPGYRPTPWEPVDSLVSWKYMGSDQAGATDDLWLGMMVEKLGDSELWPLERPETPAVTQVAVSRGST